MKEKTSRRTVLPGNKPELGGLDVVRHGIHEGRESLAGGPRIVPLERSAVNIPGPAVRVERSVGRRVDAVDAYVRHRLGLLPPADVDRAEQSHPAVRNGGFREVKSTLVIVVDRATTRESEGIADDGRTVQSVRHGADDALLQGGEAERRRRILGVQYDHDYDQAKAGGLPRLTPAKAGTDHIARGRGRTRNSNHLAKFLEALRRGCVC